MTIRKAVIPVAGLGTRFLPSTLTIPKVMIPVVDKPPIHFCVEEAARAGIDHVIFVTSQGQESVPTYFKRRPDLETSMANGGKHELAESLREIANLADISVVTQEKQLGLGHAVLMAKKMVGSQPFAVFLPDNLILSESSVIRNMIEISDSNHGSMVIALKKVRPTEVSSYGIAKLGVQNDRISDILELVEKPSKETSPSNLAVTGRYILSHKIFTAIENSTPGALGEIQLTDAITSLLEDIPCLGYEFPGIHFDVGTPVGMLKASLHIGLNRDDLKSEFREWLDSYINDTDLKSQ